MLTNKNIHTKIKKKMGEIALAVVTHPIITILVFILWWGFKILDFFGICENPFAPLGWIIMPILTLAIVFNLYIAFKVKKEKGLKIGQIITGLWKKKSRKDMVELLKIDDTQKTMAALSCAKNIFVLSLIGFVIIATAFPVVTLPLFVIAVIVGAKIVIEDITRIVLTFQNAM